MSGLRRAGWRRRRPPARPRILVLGDLALDVVVVPSRPLESGSDVAGTLRFRPGGSGGNTARAITGLGGEAALVAAVGDDRWAKLLVASLRSAGVVVHAVRRRGRTARLVVLVDATGERTFITERAAADSLAPPDLRPAWFGLARAFHLAGYMLFSPPLGETARAAVELARGAGAVVSIDLSSRIPMLAGGAAAARAAVRACRPDVLFGNASEAAALAEWGEHELLGLAPVVVIKEGRAGCRVLARTDDRVVHRMTVATKPLEIRDTTGAGDAFDAGFLLSWVATSGSRERPAGLAALRRAAVAGNRAAGRILTSPPEELES